MLLTPITALLLLFYLIEYLLRHPLEPLSKPHLQWTNPCNVPASRTAAAPLFGSPLFLPRALAIPFIAATPFRAPSPIIEYLLRHPLETPSKPPLQWTDPCNVPTSPTADAPLCGSLLLPRDLAPPFIAASSSCALSPIPICSRQPLQRSPRLRSPSFNPPFGH